MTELIVANTDNRGLEALDTADLILPQYVLVQALTKVLRNDRTGLIKEGTFYNTLTKTCQPSVTFQPLIMSKYFNLLKQVGTEMKFEKRVYAPNDPLLQGRRYFAEGDKKADVDTVLSVLCIVDAMPAIITFKKMAYSVGKELFTQAKLSRKALWATNYQLDSEMVERKGNRFFVPVLKAAGPATGDEMALAEQMYQSFKSKTDDINGQVDVESAAQEDKVPF